ncbi:membrane transporter [Plectosphaerella plurivora]|uniref:Membrane transporter n=1 Tax=Plectosphaerella plurivora TaxID=936078 RepID=A0A9P9ACJ4_9PEZI|nr:membrane transporter [Plectosphaerella plurivora]
MAVLGSIFRRLFTAPPMSTDGFHGVVVPLEEAHLHSHSRRVGRTEFEERPTPDGDDEDPMKDAEESMGMLEMSAAEYTIEGLRKEMRRGRGESSDYELRSKLVNKAIQDIGMGLYNWQLFALCGFGWFADNLWMQGVSLTLPSLTADFGVPEKTVRYTTSALFLGLCFGSFVWGVGSDVLGRRLAFNYTLAITSVFGIAVSFAPTWGWTCFFFAALGFGVGGNLPVDGALFLEFLPDASSALLTLLSVWWPVGQFVSSVIAWYTISNWPANEGWRLFVLAIGLITLLMFVIRCFVFRLLESPKFLLSKGRQAEAVAVVHAIAHRNGAKTWLTQAVMDAVVDGNTDGNRDDDDDMPPAPRHAAPASGSSVLREKLRAFSGARIRPLFQNKTLGTATALIWFCWATIGMGYPLFNAFLPQYFARIHNPSGSGGEEEGGAISQETYRNYAITSVMGIPGALLAAYLVDHQSPWLGRRGTLAISTFVSAIFLFLFVTLGTTPNWQLFFSCVEAFTQNIMYGVLYAFTPEIFPAPVRGAGTGVASFLNRVTGLAAPVIAANVPGDGTTAPVYLSAVLILAAFVGMCLIPIETRGRQRL